MRYLTIDIGTNSTLHLVADVDRCRLTLVERGISGNRLGVGKSEDGSIPPDLMALNRKILEGVMARGRELGCEKVKAVGTQALRSAPNCGEFVQMAADLGLEVEIIGGEREALLAWRGVFGEAAPEGETALLDIGGGSSELSVGRGDRPEWSLSLPVGAATLTRRFSADPPPEEEVKRTAGEVRGILADWKGRIPAGAVLNGIAGSITTIAALERKLTRYKPGALEGVVVTANQVAHWRRRLLKMTIEERRTLPGMPPARAEIIPAGAVILEQALEILGRESLRVSERGVMFGLAMEMAAPEKVKSATPR